jgi:hypothetical protein
MKPPLNDLERTFLAVRGPQHFPELFRQLRESILFFLLPYHPELEGGKMGVKNGDRLPPFVSWKNGKGEVLIPIFTSIERAQDACKAIKAPARTYAICEMMGEQLFQLLRCQNSGMSLNPATGWPDIYLDLNAIKGLADGSILKPVDQTGPQKKGRWNIVLPEDYPTTYLQALFEFLKPRHEVKAVWLFREAEPEDPTKKAYVFLLDVAEGVNAKQLQQDFGVVAQAACPEDARFSGVGFLDRGNEGLVKVTTQYAPFFRRAE